MIIVVGGSEKPPPFLEIKKLRLHYVRILVLFKARYNNVKVVFGGAMAWDVKNRYIFTSSRF